MVKSRVGIDFESITTSRAPKDTSVYGFDTGCRSYNAMYEVKQHLPLFTKTKKSKSWHAAGWYAVRQNNTWYVQQNPKLITLQRYEYRGPFHSEEDAKWVYTFQDSLIGSKVLRPEDSVIFPCPYKMLAIYTPTSPSYWWS